MMRVQASLKVVLNAFWCRLFLLQSAVSIVKMSDWSYKEPLGPSPFGLWPYNSLKPLTAPIRRRAISKLGGRQFKRVKDKNVAQRVVRFGL
jgi:hypothetical protein